MDDRDNDKATTGFLRRRVATWQVVLLIAIAGLVTTIVQSAERRPVKIPVSAEPYIWSATCPEADYKRHEPIPSGCARTEYRIADPQDYPIRSYGYKNLTYYRVGNDIDEIVCDGFGETDPCHVGRYLKNAYK